MPACGVKGEFMSTRLRHVAIGRLQRVVFAVGLSITVTGLTVLSSRAQQGIQPVQQVIIPVNKSVTMTTQASFSSAVVGSPEIADALPMTDRTLLIQAKKIGTTNVSIYDENSRLVKVVDVQVTLDTGNLQSRIRALTGDRGIHVSTDNGQIVLSGVASNGPAADQAVNLAKSWSPTGAVINAMNIASPQQVMLKVRFLEVDRNAGRELGINWYGINGSGTRGVSTGLGGLTTQPPALGGSVSPSTTTTASGTTTTPASCLPSGTCAPFGSGIFQAAGTLVGSSVGAPFGTILAEIVNNGVQIDSLITALETKGLVRTLAAPGSCRALRRHREFPGRGQIPVPIAVTSGIGIATPTIEFKDFGVLLRFRPTVLTSGVINLSINPEVSALDFTNAVSISGTTIPALTRRTATTTIELRDGQSFAIAGLLQTTDSRNISQLPWVGSIPVLGTLVPQLGFSEARDRSGHYRDPAPRATSAPGCPPGNAA